MTYLHIGCADKYYKGFINSDMRSVWKGKSHKLDMVMDVSKVWPYKNESVDGIISMHVLQQLVWRDLLFALRETYRVLKKGGIVRLGIPAIEKGKDLDYLLGWNNTNLFCYDLMAVVLSKVGFSHIRNCQYQESRIPLFVQVDNRPEQTLYIEAIK